MAQSKRLPAADKLHPWQREDLMTMNPSPGRMVRTRRYHQDHLIHRQAQESDGLIAWCGRPLDVWKYFPMERLYYGLRTTTNDQCPECRRYEAEYLKPADQKRKRK